LRLGLSSKNKMCIIQISRFVRKYSKRKKKKKILKTLTVMCDERVLGSRCEITSKENLVYILRSYYAKRSDNVYKYQ